MFLISIEFPGERLSGQLTVTRKPIGSEAILMVSSQETLAEIAFSNESILIVRSGFGNPPYHLPHTLGSLECYNRKAEADCQLMSELHISESAKGEEACRLKHFRLDAMHGLFMAARAPQTNRHKRAPLALLSSGPPLLIHSKSKPC